MVSLKTENGTTEVSLRTDKNLILQEEIMQTVVSVLLHFGIVLRKMDSLCWTQIKMQK